jgi:tetratricopeptide (TPR) repeat protein
VKRTILLTALAAALFISSCATVDNEAIQRSTAHYQIGVGHLYEKKIQPAFIEFQRAYEVNPNNKEALNAIGIIYLQHYDDTAKAIDFFQRALKVDPDYSEAYNNLGYAYEKLGRFDAAVTSYKKAVANIFYASPERAFSNMGRAYYRMGKYEDAVAAYKEAARRAPNLHIPYLGLALCYNAQGKYGDASTAMSRAIELNPAYKRDAKKAAEDFSNERITASGPEQKDLTDYLEILQY